ncbi:hypothetical protein LTR37_009505 [Vermiconidia calcicola]|uniref:Uncharacterized protein n=1 Tax=Vermiconidia calcicola TaxID=1690605 RepID=A0ACC3N7P2_9PEZI|nr:hypothetical protein LTR37_009505 [Vermiconidia calcicola]
MASFGEKLRTKLSTASLRREPSRPSLRSKPSSIPSHRTTTSHRTTKHQNSFVSQTGTDRSRKSFNKKTSIASTIRSLFVGHSADSTPAAANSREGSLETQQRYPLTPTGEQTPLSFPGTTTSGQTAFVQAYPEAQRTSFLPAESGAGQTQDPGPVRSQPQEAHSYILDGEGEELADTKKKKKVAEKKEESKYWESFDVLDGAQDEVEAPYVRSKKGGQLSVRDRVAALEQKRHVSRKPVGGSPPTKESLEKSKVPTVYPLRYKRFARRTSSGLPLRPETPLYRSQPDDEPVIHAPRPTRSIPSIRTPARTPTPTLVRAPKDGGDIGRVFSRDAAPSDRGDVDRVFSRDAAPDDQDPSRITPASFLQGTKSNCVRHGRKPIPLKRPVDVTRDSVEKSRSGAYIPTGLTKMRQMEATSPWVGPHSKYLTKTADAKAGTGASSDPCPDCVGELNIKRRELQHGSAATVQRPNKAYARPPSFIEAATPLQQPSAQSQRVSSASQESNEEDMVVSKDLGDDLDAVIVEHRGDLRRVVLNARHGKPTIQKMQRLSKELAQVSNSIAFTGISHASASTPAAGERAVVLDSRRDIRISSVPVLLDMIDEAADEIHLGTGKIAERYTSRRDVAARNSVLSSSDFDSVFGEDVAASGQQGLVERQSIDEQYRSLAGHLAGASKGKGKGLEFKDDNSGPASVVHAQASALGKESMMKAANVTLPTSGTPKVRTSKPSKMEMPLPKNATPKPFSPSTPDFMTPRTEVPQIVMTRPTLPTLARYASLSQPPAPEKPSLHYPAELKDVPTPSAALPTPKIPPEAKPSQTAFSFQNPFQRHLTPGPKQQYPTTPSPTSSPHQSVLAATPTPTPSPQTEPPLEQNPTTAPESKAMLAIPNPYHHAPSSRHQSLQAAAPKTAAPSPPAPGTESPLEPNPTTAPESKAMLPIPNPYHHAPHTPLDIAQAAYADPKVREQQQVRRMEKNKAVQEAAAMEREVRRKKSVPPNGSGNGVRKGFMGRLGEYYS